MKCYKVTFDLGRQFKYIKKMFKELKKLLFHWTVEIKNNFSMDGRDQNNCHAIPEVLYSNISQLSSKFVNLLFILIIMDLNILKLFFY
jgi:hypothetical protein